MSKNGLIFAAGKLLSALTYRALSDATLSTLEWDFLCATLSWIMGFCRVTSTGWSSVAFVSLRTHFHRAWSQKDESWALQRSHWKAIRAANFSWTAPKSLLRSSTVACNLLHLRAISIFSRVQPRSKTAAVSSIFRTGSSNTWWQPLRCCTPS